MMGLESVYQCRGCETVWRHEEDAMVCCSPGIQSGYRCPECDAFHTMESEADNCCAADDTPPIITPAELEAAGQLRILP